MWILLCKYRTIHVSGDKKGRGFPTERVDNFNIKLRILFVIDFGPGPFYDLDPLIFVSFFVWNLSHVLIKKGKKRLRRPVAQV